MAKIPDAISPLFNPLLQGRAGAEAQKAANKSREKTALRGSRFSSIMEKAKVDSAAEAGELWDMPELPDSPEAVTILQDAVQSAGDDLKNRPFPEEIQRYKRAVKNFLSFVLEKGYAAEKIEGVPNYLKPNYQGKRGVPEAQERKRYTIVQVVDDKLEQLAAGILTGQTTQLELLARLEEIHGILIDLLK
ncbi:hypothetical protein AGMMS49928_17820 [Spirochaetia bacterium]|nr:hypothetical protein AGMMS49928_17820 [Spirochaetia bacterium]